MIEHTIYIANDGTRFDLEEECKEYEKSLTDFDEALHECRVWDKDFKPLRVRRDRSDWIEMGKYFYALTERSRTAVNDCCDEWNYTRCFTGATENSMFIEYDDLSDECFDLQERIDRMRNIISFMRKEIVNNGD